MSNRIKIILVVLLFIGIIFGADRILKMQEKIYLDNALQPSDEIDNVIPDIKHDEISGEESEDEIEKSGEVYKEIDDFSGEDVDEVQNNENEEVLVEDIEEHPSEKIEEVSPKDEIVQGVIEVTSDTFYSEVIESEKVVLVDFYATWCNPCKILSPIVENFAKERKDVKVVKIDVDENIDISDEYQVYSIPTLVVIENGVEINRVVGVVSKEEIVDLVK